MKIEPYYQHAGITIYHGDCLEILPHLDPVDLVLTDPPYGINSHERNNFDKKYWNGRPKEVDKIVNDDKPMDFSLLFESPSNTKIIFGANNFYKQLPHKGIWICWDKRCDKEKDKMLGSPFELAWVDRKTGFYKIYRVLHGGIINSNSIIGNNEKRFHPREKPIRLLKLIIQDFISCKDGIVLDPFMGSGTTLVAAKELGRKAIGIEIEEKYCDIAVRRLAQEVLPFK